MADSLFYKYDSGNCYFIKSKSINVYPNAFRGAATTGVIIDPEARLQTEKNLSHVASNLANGYSSYIIDWPETTVESVTTGTLCISIGGYYMEIKIKYSDLTIDANTKIKYLNIKLGDINLFNGENAETEYTSRRLAPFYEQTSNDSPYDGWLDKQLDSTEDPWYFTGLAFSEVPLSGSSVVLQIADNTGIYAASLLPYKPIIYQNEEIPIYELFESTISPDLTYEIITNTNTCKVTGLASSVTNLDVVIPAYKYIDKTLYKVVEIEDEAFNGKTNVKSVKLPNTLQTIGAHAFQGCENLLSINIYRTTDVQTLPANSPWGATNATIICYSKYVQDKVTEITGNSDHIPTTTAVKTYVDNVEVTATDDILEGSTSNVNNKEVKYAPYTTKGAGHFYYNDEVDPDSTTHRLKYDGFFYATKIVTKIDGGTI